MYLFLEREEEREIERKEQNIDVREKLQSIVSSICHDQGPNLQPRQVNW